MSKKARKMQAAADAKETERGCQIDGHPTVCACGTVRTPGFTHKRNDTGPTAKGLGAKGCNG